MSQARESFLFPGDHLMTDVGNLSPLEALRRSIFQDGKVSQADFSRALGWDGGDSPEYAQLLADIAVDLLVDQADPPRYISAQGADWLIGQIKGQKLSYPTQMRLLTETMHYAVSLPSTLSGFCLAEIEAAITQGRTDHPKGRIDADDVENLRKAVYAPDEGASLHVTRIEAEALFRIAHAGTSNAIDPAFNKFFVQAISNYLMGIAFHGTPKAATMLEVEAFENTPAPGFGAYFSETKMDLWHEIITRSMKIPTVTLNDLESPIDRAEDDSHAELEADNKERAQAEYIDTQETAWLVSHLTRPEALTSAEVSLLAALKQEGGTPPPAMQDLFRKAGI